MGRREQAESKHCFRRTDTRVVGSEHRLALCGDSEEIESPPRDAVKGRREVPNRSLAEPRFAKDMVDRFPLGPRQKCMYTNAYENLERITA